MARDEVVRAFVDRTDVPGDPHFGVEGDALMVEGWWPAALWLGRATCLVRLDEGPGEELSPALGSALAAAGLELLGLDLDAPVEAITAHRLGLVGGRWQVWATTPAAGQADIAAAAG